MSSNIKANGTDLDNIFTTYANGTKANLTNITANNVDLQNRYTKYFTGSKAATTNITSNGTDLKDIFQKKDEKASTGVTVSLTGDFCLCDTACQVFSGNQQAEFFGAGWDAAGGDFPVRISVCHQGSLTVYNICVQQDDQSLVGPESACCDDTFYAETNLYNIIGCPINPNYDTSVEAFCYPGGIAPPCQCAGQPGC